jgi:flagellar biogenesis protein FliO
MTTSACGWPKLLHQRSRSTIGLLMLGAGLVVTAGRADAQSHTDDPYSAVGNANSRTIAPRPKSSEGRETIAAPTDPARSASHKAWKDLARAHNEGKSRETQTTGSTHPAGEDRLHETHSRGASLSPITAVGALAVVIGLILILARILRRHAPLFSQALPTEALEILGRRFLDQRQSIVLLRIGSRILVVGSSAAGLQGIGEVSDPVEVDLIAGMCRGTRSGQKLGTSFLSLLKGQSVSQTAARQRNEPPRRPEPRVSESLIANELPSQRMSDPEQELTRRLRGVSASGTPHSRGAEVFRE